MCGQCAGTFADVPNESSKPAGSGAPSRDGNVADSPPDSDGRVGVDMGSDVFGGPSGAMPSVASTAFGQASSGASGVRSDDRGGPIQGPHGFIHTIVSAARYEVMSRMSELEGVGTMRVRVCE